MNPVTELDVLVAEKVMGWEPKELFWLGRSKMFYVPLNENPETPYDQYKYVSCWKPSTDIAAAWLVVEKMKPIDIILFSFIKNETPMFDCTFNKVGDFRVRFNGWADTAPHAICLAALAAKGVKVEARN